MKSKNCEDGGLKRALKGSGDANERERERERERVSRAVSAGRRRAVDHCSSGETIPIPESPKQEARSLGRKRVEKAWAIDSLFPARLPHASSSLYRLQLMAGAQVKWRETGVDLLKSIEDTTQRRQCLSSQLAPTGKGFEACFPGDLVRATSSSSCSVAQDMSAHSRSQACAVPRFKAP